MYYDHSPADFINGYVMNLSNYVSLDWNYQLERQYSRRVPKYVAGANFAFPTAADGTLTAPVATSEITLEMLETLAANLIINRAGQVDIYGFVSITSDGPTFTILMGLEMIQKLARNVAEWRQDLRWAEPSLFMKRVGATRIIGNFRYMPNVLPPRYTHNGTAYVEVPRFVNISATKGTPQDVNPSWKSPSEAPYEAAFVLNPNVFTAEIVRPPSQVASLTFNGYGYQGDWFWVTGSDAISTANGDACYDPLKKQGRHIAEMIYAPKPGPLPVAGAIVFFKRCAAVYTLVTCT